MRQNMFFEETTGIRSQVPAIFIENSEVVAGDFNQSHDQIPTLGTKL